MIIDKLNDLTLAETHATDSYQNVLFSLLRFRLKTGVYPRHITVVTHEFKRRRFLECHFPAIGFLPTTSSPSSAAASIANASSTCSDNDKVNIIGINPPEEVTSLESLIAGEEKSGIGLWRNDLYGIGPQLLTKRRRRGWTEDADRNVFVNVGLEPVVERLVCWNGGGGDGDRREDSIDCDETRWFPERDLLPWNQ